MNTYRLNIDNNKEGDIIIIRPLVNVKNFKNNILTHKSNFGIDGWIYKYMFLARIYDNEFNGELKAFYCGEKIHKILQKEIKNRVKSLDNILPMSPLSNCAIKIIMKHPVKLKHDDNYELMDYDCEIIHDDKYYYAHNEEEKEYIKNLLNNTDIDIEKEFDIQKDKIKDVIVEIPIIKRIETIEKFKLGDIFEKEKLLKNE